ncbi:MAG: ATP-binding protein [Candidatus Micrarchaeia archaeon]
MKLRILDNPKDEQIMEIIQRIAALYHQPEAVLYEYIQNSIDSAIELEKKYGKEILPRKILVHIDTTRKRFIIQDNCAGMTRKELSELPTKTFNSKKKAYAWTPGQFGYGIQSFRGWFDTIKIYSTSIDESPKTNLLSFERNEIYGNLNEEKEKVQMPVFGSIFDLRAFQYYRITRTHGTDVFVEGITKKEQRRSSFDYISEKLITTIPIHFEEFIRSNLVEIYIYRWTKKRSVCKPQIIKISPLDYNTIPGEVISGEIKDKNNKSIATYYFKIIEPTYLNQNPVIKEYLPRISRLGTTIREIPRLESFKDYCNENNIDNTVWERPEIIGRFDITKKIEIDITRSDITPSDERDYIYSELAKITAVVKQKFDEIDKNKIKEHEKSLSDLLSDIFSDVSKEMDTDIFARTREIKSDKGLLSGIADIGAGFILGNKDYKGTGKIRTGLSREINENATSGQIGSNIGESKGEVPSSDDGNKINYKQIKQRGLQFDFHPLGEKMPPSDMWGDKIIVINSIHPFYLERLNTPKKKKITKRFISYLAFVTTPWFLDLYYKRKGIEVDSKDKNVKIVETIAKVEKMLWDKREEIKKKVAEVEEDE